MKYIIRFFSKEGYEAQIETNTNPRVIANILDKYKHLCEINLKQKRIGDFLSLLIEKGIDFKNFNKKEFSIYF